MSNIKLSQLSKKFLCFSSIKKLNKNRKKDREKLLKNKVK